MNWNEFIETGIYVEDDRKYTCNPPATQEVLAMLKKQFGLLHLPDELEELYSQTDGIGDFLYIDKLDELIETGELIWRTERVIESNNSMRTDPFYKDHMPHYKNIQLSFDDLFFIADSGIGDMFGYKTVNGKF
jgi:hypothetical protein